MIVDFLTDTEDDSDTPQDRRRGNLAEKERPRLVLAEPGITAVDSVEVGLREGHDDTTEGLTVERHRLLRAQPLDVTLPAPVVVDLVGDNVVLANDRLRDVIHQLLVARATGLGGAVVLYAHGSLLY